MDDDSIGFTFFLNISFKQHEKDFPHDTITFHDFSSICLRNWEVGAICYVLIELKLKLQTSFKINFERRKDQLNTVLTEFNFSNF